MGGTEFARGSRVRWVVDLIGVAIEVYRQPTEGGAYAWRERAGRSCQRSRQR